MLNIPIEEIYLRQLWVNIFGIHNLKTGLLHFIVYHEGQGKKDCHIKKQVPDSVTELHIFSDGCPGQKNNNVIIWFCLPLRSTKRFKEIKHYFPIRGHSFLPKDRLWYNT